MCREYSSGILRFVKMKIIQNPENGQIRVHLDHGEEYDLENHLAALTEFLIEQAQTIFDLKCSHKKLLENWAQLDRLENEFNEHIRNS